VTAVQDHLSLKICAIIPADGRKLGKKERKQANMITGDCNVKLKNGDTGGKF
jgi:hypothetical protein